MVFKQSTGRLLHLISHMLWSHSIFKKLISSIKDVSFHVALKIVTVIGLLTDSCNSKSAWFQKVEGGISNTPVNTQLTLLDNLIKLIDLVVVRRL